MEMKTMDTKPTDPKPTVSAPTDGTPDPTGSGGTLQRAMATVWVDLKPERVQDDLTATDPGTISLSLQIALDPSQIVTFGLSGSGLSITSSSVPASVPSGGPQ